MNTGKTIASLRQKRGLSQQQLAEQLNVSPSTIAMWETNKRALKDESIKSLSEFFGVSADYILGNSETEKNEPKKELTVEEALKSVMSYEGKPVTDNDRKVLASIIEAYLKENKSNE